MEYRSKCMFSFCKQLLITDDFTTQLALPPKFVEQNRDTLPTESYLQTIKQSWFVNIEKVADGKHCFTKGWSAFVKSVNLKHGDLLVFWFDCGNSTFHVSAYGSNDCEYEMPGCETMAVSDDESSEDMHEGKNKGSYTLRKSARRSGRYNPVDPESSNARIKRKYVEENLSGDDDESEDKIAGHVKNKAASPQFEMVLKKYLSSRVVLRREFTEKAGLLGKKTVNLMFAPTQRTTEVLLVNRKHPCRQELTKGWNDFCKENGLMFEKSYSFLYNREGNVILVRPIENKSRIKKKYKQSSGNPVRTSYRSNLDPHIRSNGFYKERCSCDGETENDEMNGSGNSINWTLKLTKDHESELELSKDLVKNARLSACEKLDVVENGRKLGRVFVKQRRDKFSMTAGWNEFLVRNKIVVGSTVSLDFVRGSSKLIKFKLLKSRHGGELFQATKTKVGRPPNMI